VQSPAAVRRALEPPPPRTAPRPGVDPEFAARIDGLGLSAGYAERVRLRTAELCAYQNAAYAREYLAFLGTLRDVERARRPGSTAITEAAALGLYKLMAYKDEYEVARLLVADYDQRRRSGALSDSAIIRWHLHPTFVRVIGIRKKLSLGRWFLPLARSLARLKILRGSALDLFGRTRVRRAERMLIGQYRATLVRAMQGLGDANASKIAALARLPDLVRGYEDVKLRNVAIYERQRDELLAEIDCPGVDGAGPVKGVVAA
jgi:indolepyruvate ferredoxin oxidoreductase